MQLQLVAAAGAAVHRHAAGTDAPAIAHNTNCNAAERQEGGAAAAAVDSEEAVDGFADTQDADAAVESATENWARGLPA